MLKPMNMEDSKQVLTWRNDPLVRVNMYTNNEISDEEHKSWFQRTLLDPRKKYFIFYFDGIPSGVINFTDIDLNSRTAFWGFYSGRPEQRGLGTAMEIEALKFAFNDLKLRKLNCEVLDFNTAVIGLHKKFGFKVEGVFKQQYKRGDRYFDIVRLSLNEEDWRRINSPKVFKHHEPIKTRLRKEFEVLFTDVDIQDFAKLSGDHNPVHVSDAAARELGFASRIVHGALAISRLSRHLASDFPGPGTVIVEQNVKFKKPILPNTSLRLVLVVNQIIGSRIGLDFSFESHNGEHHIIGDCIVLGPI